MIDAFFNAARSDLRTLAFLLVFTIPGLFPAHANGGVFASHGSGGVLIEPSIVTFGDTAIDDFGRWGAQVEGGMQYDPVANWSWIWPSWSLQTSYSLDGAALATSWGGLFPEVGNLLTFTMLDGSSFIFQSFDVAGRIQGARNDVVMVRGYLDGVEVASQLVQRSDTSWVTVIADVDFAAPIDALELELVETNDSALMFDTMVFLTVPEPTAAVLLAVFGGGSAIRRKRR